VQHPHLGFSAIIMLSIAALRYACYHFLHLHLCAQLSITSVQLRKGCIQILV